VNLAEMLSKLAEAGKEPEQARTELREAEGAVTRWLWRRSPRMTASRWRGFGHERAREGGLSLADRACLALAKRLGVPVVTTDRDWTETKADVEVRLIR
jgi:PIN domain nuclease of toxin-antitoxin system